MTSSTDGLRRRRVWAHRSLAGAAFTVAVLVAMAAPSLPAAVAGAAAPATALSVTPSTGLADNAAVSVVMTGLSPGSTYVVVECDPTAFTLQAAGESPADACDARHNAVVTVDSGGAASAIMHPQAVLTTSLGSSDCRTEQCFVAAESLYSTGGPALLVDDISFAPTACGLPRSCQVPADAWDASLGATAAPAISPAPTPSTRARVLTNATSGTSVPGHPLVLGVTPGRSGDLTGSDTVTGPYRGAFRPPVVSGSALGGEGLLRLALAAPHTSWAAARPSALVADVTLSDVTTSTVVSTQQVVLYAGATPFTYGLFTGPVTTADHYTVTVATEPASSSGGLSWPAGSALPRITLVDDQLEVVDPANPQYLATAYAPVLFGRSTSALHDVPMLVDATATPVSGGSTQLSYTVIWSHEDAGTGFVPFLEWGTWGRMTDIENAISFIVAPDGSTSDATYLWGGEPATGFPDSQVAIQEVDVPFTGLWDGHHPVLRDATGNNDFSSSGASRFQFRLAPVPGPAAGATRESVMDANPFTYQISGQEVSRWYGDISTDPQSPEPGDARQYATVDLATSGNGVSSLAVELQLSGGPTWYASDFHTGYPSSGTGHVRTVVKLPVGWHDQTITGVRVQAYPPTSSSSVVIQGLSVLALATDWSLTTTPTPPPTVVPGVSAVANALVLSGRPAPARAVRPGGSVHPLSATVTDASGDPLAGVPVTFVSTAPGITFTACGCSSVSVVTDSHGAASSGPARAPQASGAWDVTASVPDTATPPASFSGQVR